MKRENNVTHVGWVKINSGWGRASWATKTCIVSSKLGRKKKESRGALHARKIWKRKEALPRVRSIVEKQSSARSSEWNRGTGTGDPVSYPTASWPSTHRRQDRERGTKLSVRITLLLLSKHSDDGCTGQIFVEFGHSGGAKFDRPLNRPEA